MEENRIKSDFMLTLGKPHRHIAGESHQPTQDRNYFWQMDDTLSSKTWQTMKQTTK